MPRIFISHSAKDRSFVEKELRPLLNAYGLESWYSFDDIKPSVEWEKAIKDGLRRSDYIIVVLSPDAIKSPWVKAEVGWGLHEKPNRVVPVIRRKCDPIDLDLRLGQIQNVNYRRRSDSARRRLLKVFIELDPGEKIRLKPLPPVEHPLEQNPVEPLPPEPPVVRLKKWLKRHWLIIGCVVLAIISVGIKWDQVRKLVTDLITETPELNQSRLLPRQMSVGSSYRWLHQTHPDCQAVYQVDPVEDGSIIEARAFFDTAKDPLKTGEAIVYLTEGAVEPGDMTTFEPRRITMEAEWPPQVDIDIFVKDRNWRSAYWRIPKRNISGWSRIQLNLDKETPRIVDADYDKTAGIALGWQLSANNLSGQAQMRLKNVELECTATNKESPVRREPMEKFLNRCGVDLGDRQSSVSLDFPSNETLAYIADKRVRLVRIPFFKEFYDHLLWDNRQQVTGLNPMIYERTNSLLAKARKHHLRVLLSLIDGKILSKTAGKNAKRDEALVSNPDSRASLCDLALYPFLSTYATDNTLAGVELLSNAGSMVRGDNQGPAVSFAGALLKTARRAAPRWKILIGHESRSEMTALLIPGFDEYIVRYDPVNQQKEGMKFRRDKLDFPPANTPVTVLALLPSRGYAAKETRRPPFASYAMVEAYDYGYAGVVLASPEDETNRLGFEGEEADAFSEWARKAEAATARKQVR